MTRVVTLLLAAAVLAGLASAAPAPPDLVLGIEWRAGGGQLAWRSATTLRSRGPAVNVGGASVALRALSPDGAHAALTRSDGQLRVIRLRPLRSAWTLGTGGRHLAALVWPKPHRLVAVAGGEPAAVVLVDARARRASRRALEGQLYGAVAAGKRLVALLAPKGSIGAARLAVVEADGAVRTVALPGVEAGFTPSPDLAGTGRMASPGLAPSQDGSRVAVVGQDVLVLVELETLEVRRAPSRSLARVAKRVEGWSRTVVWVPGDRVAVVARTTSYDGDKPVSTTGGLRLHSLDSVAARTLDETATGATSVNGLLLAYGGSALRGYSSDGALRFELLDGRDTGYVQAAAGYAYVGSANSTQFVVVDVGAGRIVGKATTSKPTVVLGP